MTFAVILPLAPICIAIILLGLSLTNGLIGLLPSLKTLVMIAEVIIAIIIFSVKVNTLKRHTSAVTYTLLNTISGILTIFTTNEFFNWLIANGGDGSLGDIFSFAICLVFGGPFCLLAITSWWGSCDESDKEDFWKAFFSNIACCTLLLFLALS